MSEVKKNLFAGGGVIFAAFAVLAGYAVRESLESRQTVQPGMTAVLDSLVASRVQDVDFPEDRYFRDMTRLLRQEYFERIEDEYKLATGAVRGMIASLADPNSLFYGRDEFAARLAAMRGEYQGIGVDLYLALNAAAGDSEGIDPGAEPPDVGPDMTLRIPRLTVAAVVPGGPADLAGVQAGDWVESIDDYWVINSESIRGFRDAQKRAQAGQITTDELKELRSELRRKSEKSLLPARARERLALGREGSVRVVWNRGTERRETQIEKQASKMPETGLRPDGAFVLRFAPGAAEALARAAEGKSELRIDLRNNVLGDFNEMKRVLATIAPVGQYGSIRNERNRDPLPLSVVDGAPKSPRLTLLVDRTTGGPAEVFALALSSKGLASLSGGKMRGDLNIVQTQELPDGSGYTLVVGQYSVERATTAPTTTAPGTAAPASDEVAG
jgi:C-terminal processing protease CtpA/Prc